MDETQIADINSQVRRYLEGTLDEIDVSKPSSAPPCPTNLGLPVPSIPRLVLCWPWNLTPSGCSEHGVGAGGPLASESFQPTKAKCRGKRLGVPRRAVSSLSSRERTGDPGARLLWAESQLSFLPLSDSQNALPHVLWYLTFRVGRVTELEWTELQHLRCWLWQVQ